MFSNTVDKIVGALTTTVTKLDALAEAKVAEVRTINGEMQVLESNREDAQSEADRATRISKKLAEILG